jgi:hypothetical protein
MAASQHSTSESSTPGNPAPKKENMFLNLGFNILLPILILNKGRGWLGAYLEPHFENVAVPILLIALAFPIAYFVYDYFKRQKYNFLSILGLISVLLTGGIGILNIQTEWFAVKEAAIPALIGIAVVISLRTPYPLIRTLLYSPEIMDVAKVQAALKENDSVAAFEKLLEKMHLAVGGLVSVERGFEFYPGTLDCGKPEWLGCLQCGGGKDDGMELAGDRGAESSDHVDNPMDATGWHPSLHGPEAGGRGPRPGRENE